MALRLHRAEGAVERDGTRVWRNVISREARVVCWNREDGQAYKAVVSLTDDRVVAWEHHPGEQPNITADEFHECDVALREDAQVVEALAARGITDLDKVLFDVWAYGGSLIADRYRGMRVGWTDIWYRDHEDSNPYANPVNGLKLVVDLNRMELLEIEDTFRVEKPDVMGEYLPKYVPMPMREEPEPLEITQPEGTSFVLDGNELRWQKWSMRVGLQLPRGAGAPHRRLRGRRAQYGPWRTGCRSRRWSCPIATRAPSTTGARRSTWASGDSGT